MENIVKHLQETKLSDFRLEEINQLIEVIANLFTLDTPKFEDIMGGFDLQEVEEVKTRYTMSVAEAIRSALNLSPIVINLHSQSSQEISHLIMKSTDKLLSSCVNLYKYDSLGTQMAQPDFFTKGFHIMLHGGFAVYGTHRYTQQALPQEALNLPKVSNEKDL